MDSENKPIIDKKEDDLLDKLISRFVRFFYSKEKRIEKYVIFLTIIGFFLRLIAALNLNVLADDMVHVSQSAGVWSAKILSTHSNPALFFYLNDLAFTIFGHTTLASRFFPLIMGTLLIPLSFLITKQLLKNKKIALFAAFFTTFSTFLIRNTFGEASLIVLFFSLFGVYLGLVYLDTRKDFFLILSGISFGLGVLTKYNAPFFIAAFLLYSLFYIKSNKEKIFTKKNIKSLVIFLLIIFVFTLPPITFNYLIFKDKGITDVYFSRVVQTEATQQLYGSLAGQGNSFFSNLVNPNNYGSIFLAYNTDLIILVFGLLGLLLMAFHKKHKQIIFFVLLFAIPFILQSAGAPLPKHFVFISFMLAIPAGYALNEIIKRINSKYLNIALIIIIAAIMIVSLGNGHSTPSHYSEKSPTSQLKSYINANAGENDLVVLDARIYAARSFWIATPNHHLTSFEFIDFNNVNLNAPEHGRVDTDIYFVECVTDDCGWGFVKDQPDLNESSEAFFEQVSTNFELDKTISANLYNGDNEILGSGQNTEVYKVYKARSSFNPQLLNQIDNQKAFYFVPYLYKDLSNYVFNYSTDSASDKLLDKLSYLIIVLSVLLSILAVFYVLYLVIKK